MLICARVWPLWKSNTYTHARISDIPLQNHNSLPTKYLPNKTGRRDRLIFSAITNVYPRYYDEVKVEFETSALLIHIFISEFLNVQGYQKVKDVHTLHYYNSLRN